MLENSWISILEMQIAVLSFPGHQPTARHICACDGPHRGKKGHSYFEIARMWHSRLSARGQTLLETRQVWPMVVLVTASCQSSTVAHFSSETVRWITEFN